MSVNLEKKVVQIMIRLAPEDARRIDDLAHQARVSVSFFCKELVLGRLPPKAPPLDSALSPAATRLLQLCHVSGSNLTQLLRHATESKDPALARLVAESVIQNVSKKILQLGLKVKAGDLDNDQISNIQEALEAPGAGLNSLAKALNEGQEVALATWGRVLQNLQIALADA